MWVVLKYKSNELETLKKSFSETLEEMPEFYIPKIKYERYVNNKRKVYEKKILDNYTICRHYKFKDHKIINQLSNTRGLIYFLSGHQSNQKDLIKFVKFCKSKEDINGFLTQSFFNITKKGKAKFISGPFSQMVFDIIENKEKELKILINKISMTIQKNPKKLLYSYI
jgi:hypothetical protein